MNLRRACLLFLSLLAVAPSIGCASKLQAANLNQLHVGDTSEAELRQTFGKPDNIDTLSDGSGTSQMLSFHHQGGTGFLVWQAVDARVLIAELQNDRLRGYIFAGTRGDNETKIDPMALQKLQVGVTRRGDVAKLLGEPVGKAVPGTRMENFKGLFTPGVVEVWAWTNVTGSNGIVFQKVRNHSFFVKFDSAGRVAGTGHEDVTLNPFSGRSTRERNTAR